MKSSTIITLTLNDGEYKTTEAVLNRVDYFKSYLKHAKDGEKIFVDMTLDQMKFIMEIVKYNVIPDYREYLKYKHILDFYCIKTKSKEIFEFDLGLNKKKTLLFKENGTIIKILRKPRCGSELSKLKNTNILQLNEKFNYFRKVGGSDYSHCYECDGKTEKITIIDALISLIPKLRVEKNTMIIVGGGNYIEVIYDTDI